MPSFKGESTEIQPVLHQFLNNSVLSRSEHTAIEEPDNGKITYRDLAILSDRLCDRLSHMGVRRGDRVGIYMRKSIDAIASIFGILKTGAAYVPVDPSAPVSRNAYIMSDCSIKVVVMENRFRERLCDEIGRIGEIPSFLLLEGTGGGLPLTKALDHQQEKEPASTAKREATSSDDLAYILYTSGSTGKPKGVMLSHRNATSFIDWCTETLKPNKDDRFSSHAPFHFDLSILDIYLSIKHGATLVLIGEDIGKDPIRLATLILEKQISIWYSTPSILSLLAQYGKMKQNQTSNLRIVLFAGEVFPVKHLKLLKTFFPKQKYFNLYGPTETNVCTFFEIPEQIPEKQIKPFPIGKTCSHLKSRVIDEQGEDVSKEQEGELCISGPAVMQGYWNLPEQDTRVFFEDHAGHLWYRTGDIVFERADGNYIFVGRKDRMVKKRGYRIELGEIEACLYQHPAVREAAVIALPDEEKGVVIKAFLSCQREKRPSLIKLKRFCVERLPIYMIPDLFSFQDNLQKTSTDKIDYQKLKEMD